MDATLKWLYAAECSTGGLSAWKSPVGIWADAYPEVTGYLIPTLFKWGAGDLAIRCADWLLSVQNSNGSFNGIDKIPRPFDTSAIIQGLEAAFEHTLQMKYAIAAADAITWVRTQINPMDGFIMNPNTTNPEIYNLRASAIIENERELRYWRQRGLLGTQQRSHYVAYALEGAVMLGDDEFACPYMEVAYSANNNLMPFFVSLDWRPLFADFDYCATAQMGILFHHFGHDPLRYYNAIQVDPNGGIPQSTSDNKQILWGAKFYLDLKELL